MLTVRMNSSESRLQLDGTGLMPEAQERKQSTTAHTNSLRRNLKRKILCRRSVRMSCGNRERSRSRETAHRPGDTARCASQNVRDSASFHRQASEWACCVSNLAYSTWAVFEEAMGVADKENLPEAASEAPPLLFKAPFGSTSRGRCFLPNAHITTLVHIYRPSGSRGVGR